MLHWASKSTINPNLRESKESQLDYKGPKLQQWAGYIRDTDMSDTSASTRHRRQHSLQTSCSNCSLSSLCLPISMQMGDLDQLERIIQRGRPLHKGETLYRAQAAFQSLFAIRSGAIKASTLNERGEEQVTGFYLPGELVGLDGLADNVYTNSAQALETASVCEIPFHRIEELSAKVPSLQRHLFQVFSREITQEQQLLAMLNRSRAEERLAALLVSMSMRHQRRQLSPTQFRLPMSRSDMGNFLGLTIETVSRVLKRLQEGSILAVHNKEVQILDMPRLRALAS